MKYLIWILLFVPIVTFAHPGNTDKYGCHTCYTNCSDWGLNYNQYHCHSAKYCTSPSISDCDISSITAINARRGLIGSSMGNTAISECQLKHDNYLKAQQNYQNCLNSISNSTTLIPTKATLSNEEIDAKLKSGQDTLCSNRHGSGSVWDESLITGGFGLKCTESRDERIDKIFQKYFKEAMTSLPIEYNDIVDPEIIKPLTLLKSNENKTFTQIIKERYGKQVGAIINQKKQTVDLEVTNTKAEATSTKDKVVTSVKSSTSVSTLVSSTSTSNLVTTSDQIIKYQSANKQGFFHKFISFIINIFK